MEAGQCVLEEWKGLFDEEIALVLSGGEQAYRITAAAACGQLFAGLQLELVCTADALDAAQVEAEGSTAAVCRVFGVASPGELVGRTFVSKEHSAGAAATELFLAAAVGHRRSPPSLEEFTNAVAASFAALTPPDLLDSLTPGELLDLCTAVFEAGDPEAWARHLQAAVATASDGGVEVAPATRALLPQLPEAAGREVLLQVRRHGDAAPALVLHLLPHSLAGWTVYTFE